MTSARKKAGKKKTPPKTVPPFVQIAISGAHDQGYAALVYGLDKDGRVWWLEDDGDSEGWERLQINVYKFRSKR